MRTKLCIFDLDGTLLDTIDDIASSMNRVLNAKNYPSRSVAWYKGRVGHGATNLMLDSLPAEHGLDEKSVETLVNMYKEDYLKNSTIMTKPYDGIPELLRFLSDSSVQLAVVTNKAQKSTDAVLKSYFGEINFVAVFGEIPGRPIKPDPYAAREILSSTGFLPEQAVFIGDAEMDMLFAENASIFSIGVLWGFRDRAILEEYGAKALVERPEQIIELLN